jgi:hypothetical protein
MESGSLQEQRAFIEEKSTRAYGKQESTAQRGAEATRESARMNA